MFGLGRHRDSVAALHGQDLAARVNADEAARLRAERDSLAARVGRLQMDVAAAESAAERYASSMRKVVDDVLYGAPESWDADEAAESIAVSYVRALEARCDAVRLPRDKRIEDGDGAPWPDAAHNPHGFADLADAYREHHSGCRCVVLGLGTPEHRPSVLCMPRPGERRCGECGTFGHVHEPVPFDDPWADVQPDGSTTAKVATYPPPAVDEWTCARCGSPRWVAVSLDEGFSRKRQCVPCGRVDPVRLTDDPAGEAVRVTPGGTVSVSDTWCGKPVRSAPGDPEMICSREPGHAWSPWCGNLPAEVAQYGGSAGDTGS